MREREPREIYRETLTHMFSFGSLPSSEAMCSNCGGAEVAEVVPPA